MKPYLAQAPLFLASALSEGQALHRLRRGLQRRRRRRPDAAALAVELHAAALGRGLAAPLASVQRRQRHRGLAGRGVAHGVEEDVLIDLSIESI